MQHVRRVRGVWDYNKNQGAPQRFKTYSLKLGDTIQILSSSVVTNWVQSISVSSSSLNRSLVELPKSSKTIEINDITEYLFDKGISSNAISGITRQLDELIRIVAWYQRTETPPSESETITYLVIPLLRVLGWTPQKMAVEWNNVGVALFKALPRSKKNLSVVLEAKRKGYSCLTTKSQAQNYAIKPNRSACSRLIVTDGIRYGVYLKNGGKFRNISKPI